MSQTCLICGGTKRCVDGSPCPECTKNAPATSPVVRGIPAQYQGVRFDKSFLPQSMQKEYGTFMEELLTTILNDYAFYQKNMIICSRPNSGKTVWSYTLYAELTAKGYDLPPLVDIVEVKNILNSYDDNDANELYSKARCAIIKLPRDMQFWLFNTISYIVERRVRYGGFTIFLFGGTVFELDQIDRDGCLKWLRGSGAYNTVKIESFE